MSQSFLISNRVLQRIMFHAKLRGGKVSVAENACMCVHMNGAGSKLTCIVYVHAQHAKAGKYSKESSDTSKSGRPSAGGSRIVELMTIFSRSLSGFTAFGIDCHVRRPIITAFCLRLSAVSRVIRQKCANSLGNCHGRSLL